MTAKLPMVPSIADLPWLPRAPADFSAQCKALAPGEAGSRVQHLASHSLSPAQSAQLARAIRRFTAQGVNLAPLVPFRLGVLSGATVEILADCMAAAAARHGVALELLLAPYDQVIQQAIDPTSQFNLGGLDAVLLAVDHRWLGLDRPNLKTPAGARVGSAMERLRSVVEGLRTNGKTSAILQTLASPPQSLFGGFDRRVQGTIRAMIDEANRQIVELAQQTGSYLLDVAALAERAGTDRWFDPAHWISFKAAFSAEFDLAYADMLGRLLGAIRGKARKCLVLDLDNTLWGGVIGDDGLEGIRIGQGDPLGEAFLAVQALALDLRERGIVLAVSSRNDDETARAPFREHPDMLLKEKDFAVFQANWADKASNLEAIAKALNIGLDAMVLLDDNPAERAQVRSALPMVAVPELPSDPSWYPWYLSSAGYFEAASYSDEDRLRAASYASDARRAEVQAQARDLGNYLTSLEMVMAVSPFDRNGRQRIAQLINKTNQFNLTTRRYTEAEVAAIEGSGDYTLQARLEDRFGDLGMIGVVIAKPDGDAWLIDTWLMSCRVLGRKVEEAMLTEVARAAHAAGIRRLVGTYIPTPKNAMVADHYSRLGFIESGRSADGGQRYELALAAYGRPDLPMKIVRKA